MLKWYFTGASTILATKAAKRGNTKSVDSLAVLMMTLSLVTLKIPLQPNLIPETRCQISQIEASGSSEKLS